MSYQVLARKWRPHTFTEMVGQEHAVRALTNGLEQGRLHHAYLFTGTRGVGKTTLARIVAKALNCEQGVSSKPCGACASCRGIDEGRFPDLLEVDAASRTRVDETRELLENVPYAPVQGRYKIYLIDEVHMFSGHSFNALLKTLEEPPPHVKFLLATTDPQKLPVTVLSRCLQFNLKRLPPEQISGQLEFILGQEGAEYEQSALGLLARAADGSMRDALSLMDQALAFGGGRVREDDVRSLLGDLSGDQVFGLLGALAEGDAAQLLTRVGHLTERAPDYVEVLTELLAVLHRIALVQAVPDAIADDRGDEAQLRALAERLSTEDVQLYYQIGLLGQRDLPLAPDPRSGFEMVLLRMLAFRPVDSGGDSRPARQVSHPASAGKQRQSGPVLQPAGAVSKAVSPADPHKPDASLPDLSDWDAVVQALKLGGVARQLADNCSFDGWDGKALKLRLDPACKHLQVGSSEERLRGALQEKLGAELRLAICVEASEIETPARRQARERDDRQRRAEQVLADDPLVHAMEAGLDARLVPDSIKPVER